MFWHIRSWSQLMQPRLANNFIYIDIKIYINKSYCQCSTLSCSRWSYFILRHELWGHFAPLTLSALPWGLLSMRKWGFSCLSGYSLAYQGTKQENDVDIGNVPCELSVNKANIWPENKNIFFINTVSVPLLWVKMEDVAHTVSGASTNLECWGLEKWAVDLQ